MARVRGRVRRIALAALDERFRDRYVASVQRHEVQHRLDFDRGLVPVPPSICRMKDEAVRFGSSLLQRLATAQDGGIRAAMGVAALAADDSAETLVQRAQRCLSKDTAG